MKFLFHLHTNYSYDCIIKPAFIVNYALKNDIGIIAITDHDTINGSIEAFNYVKSNNLKLQVITGAEYFTDCGDIIGLFLENEIFKKNALELIDEIHRQGGIAVLPHPYKSHNLSDELVQKIDVIEIFNSRCSALENEKALQLAKKFNKPCLTGNDAHLKTELKLCYNSVGEMPLKEAILAEKSFFQTNTSKVSIIRSQLIKGYKKRDLVLILRMLKSISSIIIFQPLRNFFKLKKNI